MPAQLSLADQQRDWRKAGRVAELALSIISAKGPRKMRDPARKKRDCSSDVKSTALEHKRKSCAPPHTKSPQIIFNKRKANTAELNALNVDERLQLARERREAQQKQLALRERSWLAREERAKHFYEKQLEERRRKLEEQRQKEERRRIAVEEKRQKRLKEERERYESVVQKTMQKSQKIKQKLIHYSRRTANSTQSNKNAKRRSLSQWEIDLVSRLQTPTISYLARSRSSVCLSRDTASCHSTNSSKTQKDQVHCGKAANRPACLGPSVTIRRTANTELVAKGGFEGKDQMTQLQMTDKTNLNQDTKPQETAIIQTLGLQTRPHLRHALPKQDGLPPLLEEEDLEQDYEHNPHLQQHEETTSQTIQRDITQDEQLQSKPALNPPPCSLTRNGPSQIGDEAQIKSSAWTTNPEEATRLLAEKRRQARLRREKEEEEHKQKMEMERRNREELARRRAEERARQEAEVIRLEEELRKREEEKRHQAEQENVRRQIEEQKRLQQQREEEALQRAQAEQQRLERETRIQREEAERLERKKRLEEIMKRTRKTESEDKKPASVKDTASCENMKPVRIPGPGKTSTLEMREEDMLPAVAFKERRSFRPLSGLEEMKAHQQAEVI